MIQRGPALKRRLVAMMFTDIVSYSALSKARESLSCELLEEHRAVLRDIFPSFDGREVKTIGDAFFVEFSSVIAAVECAIAIQSASHERNSTRPESQQLQMRVGIHLGDIIENKNDYLGDHLNTASRIESFAPPGGICFTRQVFDQIRDNKIPLPIRRLGFRKIKNVDSRIEVYRVVLPFEAPGAHSYFRKAVAWGKRVLLLDDGSASQAREQAPLLALTVGALAVLGAMALSTWKHMPLYYGTSSANRTPSDIIPGGRTDLSKGWRALSTGSVNSLEQALRTPDSQWVPYDPNKPWEFRDKFNGDYWLEKDFDLSRAPARPAAVLGLIRNSHEVYVNGSFVGGSNHYSPVTWYAFDRTLLKEGTSNRLLVHGETGHSLMPGFQLLGGELLAFLGEFNDVQSTVTRDAIRFHIPSAVYLTTTLLAAIFCLVSYLLVQDRGRLLYFSLYLLLGAAMLAYYNPIVISTLDDTLMRGLKALSLTLSSAVLLSTYLHLTGRTRLARFNNWATLAAVGVFFAAGLVRPFFEVYNGSLGFGLVYSVIWVVSVSVIMTVNFARALQHKRWKAHSDEAYGTLVFFFALLNLFLIASSFKASSSLLPEVLRVGLRQYGMSYPFLFSLLVFAFTAIDYAAKSRAQRRSKARDQLVLDLIRVMSEEKDLDSTIATIQKEVVHFVDAERSSLYLLSPSSQSQCLLSTFIVGSAESQRFTRSVTRLDDGLMKEVLESKKPLLIKDIAKDYRFSRFSKNGSNATTYKSGSCMLLPLIMGGQSLGILTLADKRGGAAFTSEDFEFLQTISKDLALLVSSHSLQRAVATAVLARIA